MMISARIRLAVSAAGLLAAAIIWHGCDNPGGFDISTTTIPNRVVAYYSPQEPPMNDPRNKIWDKALTGAITVGDSADSALPNYFGKSVVYLKAIKTPSRLYLRAEWGDATRNIDPNGIVSIVTITYDTITTNPLDIDTIRETTWERRLSYVVIVGPDGNTEIRYDQDRLAVLWDMGDNDPEKADCRSMCHDATHLSTLGHRMYTTGGGHVDLWHWQAATSDPVQLAVDEYWDASGRVPDEQISPIATGNYDAVKQQPLYSHRDTTAFADTILHFEDAVAFRDSILWPNRYEIPGFVVYDNASGSIANVSAFSGYSKSSLGNRWTVIMSRALTTGNVDDRDFSAIDAGDSVMVTIAVMNNADRFHSGSAPFYIKFP